MIPNIIPGVEPRLISLVEELMVDLNDMREDYNQLWQAYQELSNDFDRQVRRFEDFLSSQSRVNGGVYFYRLDNNEIRNHLGNVILDQGQKLDALTEELNKLKLH